MPFAFGRETHDRVVRAINNLRRFESNERTALDEGLVGLPGPYRRLTGCRYGALPQEYVTGLDEATYVVYCYGTPIAWVVMADDATEEGRVNFMPDWQYSATTTYYQGLVWEAWGDKIVDPRPDFSRAENRGTNRGRSSDERYGRVPRPEPAAPRRRPSREPYGGRTDLTPPYLLDSRYADPDWVPGRDLDADREIEHKDWEKLMTDRSLRYRAHP